MAAALEMFSSKLPRFTMTRGSLEFRNTFLWLFTFQTRCLLLFSSELGTEELKILDNCSHFIIILTFLLSGTEIFTGFMRYPKALSLCALARTKSLRQCGKSERGDIDGHDEGVEKVARKSSLELDSSEVSRFFLNAYSLAVHRLGELWQRLVGTECS